MCPILRDNDKVPAHTPREQFWHGTRDATRNGRAARKGYTA
jgi:hypothetical protein